MSNSAGPEPLAVGRRDIRGAVEAWADALGREHVLTDDGALADYVTATFRTSQTVTAVLRPANRAEVQACVHVANRFRAPIYPVSRGKNWGFGSRVPAADGCAVMDLARLDRIVDFSEELGYATVEPGVTFRQMYDFLGERRSNLMLSTPGSSPDASLIGNALEHGHGFGPQADRFNHTCALEVVLPLGECIHTGFDRFPNAPVAPLHRYGVGPYVDGMFSQSNLGIVTRMTIWLEPQPADFQILLVSLSSDDQLGHLIDALRSLRSNDRTDFKIANELESFRLAFKQRRWFNMAEFALAGIHPRRTVRWIGRIAMYSDSAEEGRARARAAKQLLGGIVDGMFFRDRRLNAAGKVLARPLSLMGLNLGWMSDWQRYDGFVGAPSQDSARYVYTATNRPPPANAADINFERDRCGVIWICPTIPLVGRDVRAACAIIGEVGARFGLQIRTSMRPMSFRSIDGVVGLLYDREVEGQDERAMDCAQELQRQLNEAGYLPYRLGIHTMENLPRPRDDYESFLRTLKTALDPNDILAPGRYDVRR